MSFKTINIFGRRKSEDDEEYEDEEVPDETISIIIPEGKVIGTIDRKLARTLAGKLPEARLKIENRLKLGSIFEFPLPKIDLDK